MGTCAPSAAWVMDSGSSRYSSVPSRLRSGCSSTWVTTYRLPGVPPRGAASPSPVRRIWWPSSMPAGTRHPQRALALRAAVAAAGGAGLLDDLAAAAAATAGRHVDHLAEHRGAHLADLAAAVALGAGHGLRALLGAAAAAGLAAVEGREGDLLLGAVDGLVEASASGRSAGPRRPGDGPAGPASPVPPAEEGVEDVAEALEAAERAVAARRPCRPRRPGRTCRRPGGAADRRGPGRPR